MQREFANVPILKQAYLKIYDSKSNCLIGVTGKVGLGKSHTCVHLAKKWDPNFRIEDSLVYTVSELIEKTFKFMKLRGVALSLQELTEKANLTEWLEENAADIDTGIGNVIIFDETANGAYVREFWSQPNQQLAKIIMLWRFLRLLVFFVVPEKMQFADSTIAQFLDIEVKMKRKMSDHAQMVAWTYEGWDEVRRKPIKRRLDECKGHGYISITPLDPETAEKYERISKIYKLRSIVDLVQKKDVQRKERSLGIEIMAKQVKNDLPAYTNRKGRVDAGLIQMKFGISRNYAYSIKNIVDLELYQATK